MSDIYIYEEEEAEEFEETGEIYEIYEEPAMFSRPGNGHNCNGHFTSIAAGGRGHWDGDGCGCDGGNPQVSIELIIPFLLITGILLIFKKIKI